MYFKECAHRFPVPLYGNDGGKQDKFILTIPQDQLKCVVTLTGDHISQAVCFNISYFWFMNRNRKWYFFKNVFKINCFLGYKF